ncbi:MAG: hypothetical protein ACJAWT_002035 [Glaciecola sp.]|jgi:hypothetical protein
MPIAIESNSPGQYLDSMESQSVMLGSVIFQPNDEQKNSLVDGVDTLPNLIDRPAQETTVKD